MTRWSVRGFVLAGMGFLVLWQVAVLTEQPRAAIVGLALYGFVFHVVFGKAFSLIPAYFDRQLVTAWGPRLQLPLTVLGATFLSVDPVIYVDVALARLGAILWGVGAVVFVTTLVSTLGTNLHGAATGTGGANRHRRRVDRIANAFVPVALAYLVVGTYETVAGVTRLRPLLDGAPPRASHLLAVGTATLLVFSIGARLLPRFFVADPPKVLVASMLLPGAVAPGLLALGFGRTAVLQLGGAALFVGMASYAGVVLTLARRSDRRRIGLAAVVLGAISGVIGVTIGLFMAVAGPTGMLVAIHIRVITLGFLGVTIVGVLFQFYPPAIGTLAGISDRWAAASIGLIAMGVGVEATGILRRQFLLTGAGRTATLLGAIIAAWIIVGLTIDQGT